MAIDLTINLLHLTKQIKKIMNLFMRDRGRRYGNIPIDHVMGGGGGTPQISIQGCAANMDRVFNNFDTFMGHKFAYFCKMFWYIDGSRLQFAYVR